MVALFNMKGLAVLQFGLIRLGVLFIVINLTLVKSVWAIDVPPPEIDYNKLSQRTIEATVKIRPLEVKLGEPITLVVEGEYLTQSIAVINWSFFTKDFVIDDIEESSDDLRVKFYAFKAGKFNIKAQSAGYIDIPETTIQVNVNPEVTVNWKTPSNQAYSQQQIVWKAEVETQNPAYLVEVEPRNVEKNPDITVHQFEDKTFVAYEMPSIFNAQQVKLDSPVVLVKNTTQRRWKFFDTTQTINLKPLPNFLPASVPVGQLDWQISPMDWFYASGQLHYWNWQLKGHALTKDYLKTAASQLIAQLPPSDKITWLTESIQVEQNADNNGMLSTANIQIPFRMNQPGLVSLPNLILRGFNPNTGKVEQQTWQGQTTLVVPSLVIWLVQWVLLLLLIGLSFILLLALKQAWLNHQLIENVNRANNALEIWQAMLSWKNNQAWQSVESVKNGDTLQTDSIGIWQQWYLQHFSKTESQIEDLQSLVNLLNSALFAQTSKTHEQTTLLETDPLKVAAEAWSKQQSIWPSLQQIWRYGLKLGAMLKGVKGLKGVKRH
ncbi:hypothetical protein [Thiomicrorhabdus sp. Milos-T2]|uniref:hypothetical protein n=1 Tax=Thiomicrorhabdus sp. Milos-T2 TaxID=90814 RepID=UPI000494BA13|nr:hypothetical protein [Thiomicrorhabdus sp. Milos-T2]